MGEDHVRDVVGRQPFGIERVHQAARAGLKGGPAPQSNRIVRSPAAEA
jgi:hypothetical protein